MSRPRVLARDAFHAVDGNQSAVRSPFKNGVHIPRRLKKVVICRQVIAQHRPLPVNAGDPIAAARTTPFGVSAALGYAGMSSVVASFVILNWRHEEESRACAESVLALDGDHEIEVIVVDNESTEVSRAALDDRRWTVVPLERNEGFAGGMNAGGRRAQGEFIALLNNDLRLPHDWLEVALGAMTDESVGIVGGRTEHTTLPRIDVRGFTRLLSEEVPRCYVPSVDGSHLFVHRSLWEQLGGFDEDFFAYYDEADLCARVMALGRRVLYEPARW